MLSGAESSARPHISGLSAGRKYCYFGRIAVEVYRAKYHEEDKYPSLAVICYVRCETELAKSYSAQSEECVVVV